MELTEQTYETLPQNIKDILDSWDDNKDLYAECNRIGKELKPLGYEIEYGLSGDITDITKRDVFEEVNYKDLNKVIDTNLTEDMNFNEIADELDRTENSYFYISLTDEDILEAIENEKEIAEQLNLWLVCIMPQCTYIALHQ